nr:unnamed protein product [Spirometra erinaceieuropaei]
MTAAEDQEIPHVCINIHANLEAARKKAVETQSRGPRVLICGQESVGKSTLCRTLVNYATRKNAKPILVDVNVGLNQICIPTTMAAMAVTKPYDLYEGWGLEEDPLVFCFGHLDPAANLNLFREQVNQLADLVNIRSENDAKVFTSGCIINMDLYAIDKQCDIVIQFVCAVIDVYEEQCRAKNRALGNTTPNGNLGRLLVTDVDGLRAAD